MSVGWTNVEFMLSWKKVHPISKSEPRKRAIAHPPGVELSGFSNMRQLSANTLGTSSARPRAKTATALRTGPTRLTWRLTSCRLRGRRGDDRSYQRHRYHSG